MKKKKFSDLFEFLPKSKVKAGDGREVGKYPFFKSGKDQSKRIDRAIYNGEYLIIGDGGSANVTYYNGEFSTSDHCYVATLKDTKSFYTPYIYLYLKSNLYILEAGFKGVAIKNISKKYISNIKIPLPESLNNQIKIANLLIQVDSLIAKREESIKLLDELLKCTFLDMFGDVFTNSKKFPQFYLKEITEKVQIGPFGSQLHQKDYIINGIPLINPIHIVDKKIKPDSMLTIPAAKYRSLPNYHLSDNDIILARRGEMGRCAIVLSDKSELFCGTGSLFLRPNNQVNPFFLLFCLSGKSGKKYLEKNSKGVTMMNLNKKIIENIKIGLPPKPLQDKFATIVQQVEQIKEQHEKSLQELQNLFGSLSQRAFRGELS